MYSDSSIKKPQFCGTDRIYRVSDDITGQDLTSFANFSDLLIWRTSVQPEANRFILLEKGKEIKMLNLKALSTRLLGLSQYFEKKGLESNDHVLLILPPDLDFLMTVQTCIYQGLIPITTFNPHISELEEQVLALIEIVQKTNPKAIIVNNETEVFIKKIVSFLKNSKSKSLPKIEMPPLINVKNSSAPKNSSEMIPNYNPRWQGRSTLALICSSFSDSNELTLLKMGHDTIFSLCRQIKDFNKMNYSQMILANCSPYCGLGLILHCFLGIYSGASTVIFPFHEVDLYPNLWLESISRHRGKNN